MKYAYQVLYPLNRWFLLGLLFSFFSIITACNSTASIAKGYTLAHDVPDFRLLHGHRINWSACWDGNEVSHNMPKITAMAVGLHQGSDNSFREQSWLRIKKGPQQGKILTKNIGASLVVFFKDDNDKYYPLVLNDKSFKDKDEDKGAHSSYFVACQQSVNLTQKADLYPTVYINSNTFKQADIREQFINELRQVNDDVPFALRLTADDNTSLTEISKQTTMSSLILNHIKDAQLALDVDIPERFANPKAISIIFLELIGKGEEHTEKVTIPSRPPSKALEKSSAKASSKTTKYKKETKRLEIKLPNAISDVANEIKRTVKSYYYDDADDKTRCPADSLTTELVGNMLSLECALGDIIDAEALDNTLSLVAGGKVDIKYKGQITVKNRSTMPLESKRGALAVDAKETFDYDYQISDIVLSLSYIAKDLPDGCQPKITPLWQDVLDKKEFDIAISCDSSVVTMPAQMQLNHTYCLAITGSDNKYQCYFEPNESSKTLSFAGYQPLQLKPKKDIVWLEQIKLRYPFEPLPKAYGNVIAIEVCGKPITTIGQSGYSLKRFDCQKTPQSGVLKVATYDSQTCQKVQQSLNWDIATVDDELWAIPQKYADKIKVKNTDDKINATLNVKGYTQAELSKKSLSVSFYTSQAQCNQNSPDDKIDRPRYYQQSLPIRCKETVAKLFKNGRAFSDCAVRHSKADSEQFSFDPLVNNAARDWVVISLSERIGQHATALRNAVIDIFATKGLLQRPLSVIFVTNENDSLLLNSEQWDGFITSSAEVLKDEMNSYPFQMDTAVNSDIIALRRMQLSQSVKLARILYIGPKVKLPFNDEAVTATAVWQNTQNVPLMRLSPSGCQSWQIYGIKAQCESLDLQQISAQLKEWLKND